MNFEIAASRNALLAMTTGEFFSGLLNSRGKRRGMLVDPAFSFVL